MAKSYILPQVSHLGPELCNIELYDAEDIVWLGSTCGGVSYINTKEKRRVLKALRKEIEIGRVDKPIIPYLEKLNAIPGVCTQFCCMGHVSTKRKVGREQGNILLFTDWRRDMLLKSAWHDIAEWPECTGISTGFSNKRIRWGFHWKVTKHKSYYREFLNKLLPILRGKR